ncbi:MAG: hypothetical protein ACLQNE_22770 [Thermoguttaceae bacterium]|jgi:hypothetical protein
MPEKKLVLNRFPLLGLFAYRAAHHMGYSEEEARLLGYSTALLYAIYKTKAQAKKEKSEEEPRRGLPEEVRRAKTTTIEFGGQEFTVIPGNGKRLMKTIVGHEVQESKDYDAEVKAKFPEGWHDRLAKAFDEYLEDHDPEDLNKGSVLFNLYKVWRDQFTVGFHRVDLKKLLGWLKEQKRPAG